MAQPLQDKIALVTGASRGIGAAIATRLAADGATVAITYVASPDKAHKVVDGIVGAGGKAVAIQADSGKTDDIKRAVATVVDAYGKIDILVNNAGVITLGVIGEIKETDFERALDINVRGVFTTTQEVVRHMGTGGRIIMMGSVNSDLIPFPGASIYTMTKGAVAGFTRGLARDLGPRGITVNNIQPGPIDTDLNPADGQFAAAVTGLLAVGHYGKTADVAALVAFLASPEAGYITGAQIKIDGGFAA